MVLPRGAHMCQWPAVTAMLDRQAEKLSDMGLQLSVDMVSTTLDLSLVLGGMCSEIAKGRTDSTWKGFAGDC